MEIGLSAMSFPQDRVEVAIDKIAKLGAECVEIVCDLPHFTPVDNSIRERIKDILNSSKINSSVHSPFFELNLGSNYSQIYELSLDQIKKSIDFSSFIHASPVVIHPGYSPLRAFPKLYHQARERFIRGLKECVEYASEKGVPLCIENIQSRYFFCYDLKDTSMLAQEVSGLGIALDIGHAYIMKKEKKSSCPEEEIADEIQVTLKPFLNHVHIHDNRGRRDEHLALGQGEINFAPIARAVKQIGFQGKIIIETWEPESSEGMALQNLVKTRHLFQGD